jgi:hypothetical protein
MQGLSEKTAGREDTLIPDRCYAQQNLDQGLAHDLVQKWAAEAAHLASHRNSGRRSTTTTAVMASQRFFYLHQSHLSLWARSQQSPTIHPFR